MMWSNGSNVGHVHIGGNAIAACLPLQEDCLLGGPPAVDAGSVTVLLVAERAGPGRSIGAVLIELLRLWR